MDLYQTMDEAHAEDMKLDGKLNDARRLLIELVERFARYPETANVFGTAADRCWEERQRIVRRWD